MRRVSDQQRCAARTKRANAFWTWLALDGRSAAIGDSAAATGALLSGPARQEVSMFSKRISALACWCIPERCDNVSLMNLAVASDPIKMATRRSVLEVDQRVQLIRRILHPELVPDGEGPVGAGVAPSMSSSRTRSGFWAMTAARLCASPVSSTVPSARTTRIPVIVW